MSYGSLAASIRPNGLTSKEYLLVTVAWQEGQERITLKTCGSKKCTRTEFQHLPKCQVLQYV